jgi:ribosomal protein S12 methylthiotransferase
MAAGRIVPYLDIPFQHANPRVLKAMRRPADHERLLGRLQSWRAACPDLAIRSTFIVGFPGETDDEFESLLEWLEAADLDRVGCFKYEDVAGAPSNDLPDQVDEDVKEERHQRLTETARRISDRRAAALVGRTVPAIIDEVDEEGAIGRSTRDSPDVDGSVYLNGATALVPGDIVEVKVEAAEDYDLWGEPVRRMRPPPGAPLPPHS